MKRLFCLVLAIILAVGTLPVSYAKNGDILGYAKYTDISAYINHYPITSYNINNHTYVIAEDLGNYGFAVTWNPYNRSLTIKRSSSKKITPYGQFYSYASKRGLNAMPYLETDIKTYANNRLIQSYNVNGKTAVNIEDLNSFGKVVWVPEVRAIKMWIDDLPQTTYKALPDISTTYPKATTTTSTNTQSQNTAPQNTSPTKYTPELKASDIDVELGIPHIGEKNSFLYITITNNSTSDIIIPEQIFRVNGYLWFHDKLKGKVLIISPGRYTRIMCDSTIKNYLDKDSEGYLKFEWNDTLYSVIYGKNGIIKFSKGSLPFPS